MNIEVKYEKSKDIKLQILRAMNFFKNINIKNLKIENVDFAFVSILSDFISYFQEINIYENINSEIEREIYHLSFKHPKKEYFKECNDAPIIDSKENTVSLIYGEDIKNDLIYDGSLAKYKIASDIEYSNL